MWVLVGMPSAAVGRSPCTFGNPLSGKSTLYRVGLAGATVSYRIEQACGVDSFGNVRYFIYRDGRLVALYWHDYRKGEHGIEFVRGLSDRNPVGRVADFMESTDPDSPNLSALGVAYLDQRA